MRRWIYALALLTVVAACTVGGTDADHQDLPPVQPPIWDEFDAWTVGTEPILSIGSEGGVEALRFNQIKRVESLADDRILVINAGGPPAIRIFRADGTLDAAFGDEGRGPGEFVSILDAWMVSASAMVAFDRRQLRATWLSLSGELIRTQNLAGLLAGGMVPLGRFSDGSWLLAANVPDHVERPEGRLSVRLIARGSPDGFRIDTIGAVEEGTAVRHRRELELPLLMPPIGTYRAVGERLYTGYPDDFILDVRKPSDEPIHQVRSAAERIPLTDRLLEDIRLMSLQNVSPDRANALRRQFTEKPLPAYLPAFSGAIAVDVEENLWVQHPVLPQTESVDWSVFDAAGRFLGYVSMPARFTATHVARDRILGVWKDSLDVETVRIYALRRTTDATLGR